MTFAFQVRFDFSLGEVKNWVLLAVTPVCFLPFTLASTVFGLEGGLRVCRRGKAEIFRGDFSE